MVRWLGPHASIVWDRGLIPDQRTNIPQAAQPNKQMFANLKKKNKHYRNLTLITTPELSPWSGLSGQAWFCSSASSRLPCSALVLFQFILTQQSKSPSPVKPCTGLPAHPTGRWCALLAPDPSLLCTSHGPCVHAASVRQTGQAALVPRAPSLPSLPPASLFLHSSERLSPSPSSGLYTKIIPQGLPWWASG